MLVLHYAPDNASLIVRLVLEELGLPYRCVLVDRRAQAQKSPDYLALNPQGLIPVLETPQGPIWETGAILLWLAETTGRMLPPPGDAARGAALGWLFFLSNTLHADLRMQFYPARYAPDPASIRPLTTARLAGHFRLLEGLAGQGLPWFGGADPSLLDCYAVVAMRWAALYTAGGPRWFHAADYPALHALALRLEGRALARAAASAEGLGPTPFSDPNLPDPPEGFSL
jgi:glutathione S-transferase